MRLSPRLFPRGFTLVEILVVVAIMLLSTLIALPVLYSSLNGRQVTDAAGILVGALAGARDSAIRQNEPRGIRLMPDPSMTIPALGSANAGSQQLVFNRIVPIEPAADYSSGKVSIGPQLPAGQTQTGFPPVYPLPSGTNATYPFPSSGGGTPFVLMVEESPFVGGFVSSSAGTLIPNEPTNFFWNIRVGDKIKFNGTGRAYTVVGPCTINPWATGSNQGNPELFVNVGPPGTTPPLTRSYYLPSTSGPSSPQPFNPEFLFVANGNDDNQDGFIDSGWDGYDNNANGTTDELLEWEQEAWEGSLAGNITADPGDGSANSPSTVWLSGTNFTKSLHDSAYSIGRRPMPSPGAREILLPSGVVIDATTWNLTQERSRLPVQPGSLYVDVLLNPNGLFIPTTAYSTPTSTGATPFLHFWLTDKADVYPIGQVTGQTYLLPMATDAMANDTSHPGFNLPGPGFYPPAGGSNFPVLKNGRRLVTLFAQSGMVVTNTLDSVPNVYNPDPKAINPISPGEGFNVNDVNQPFYRAQLGQREVK